jgi:phosphatidyl-myo-inositol alpha-mannosyltransferase
VNGHVAELAAELSTRHDVRILAPWDPPDRITRLTHRGEPQEQRMPENFVPLGRSFSLSGNGSVTNLAWSPTGMVKLRRALASEPFDVVHVQEPVAPFIGPDACSWRGAPVVGTFHAYSTNAFTNNLGNLAGVRRKLNQLHARIAVSEAAAWTGRRWFGGQYTVIPNGVDLSAPPSEPKQPSAELRVLFVGRPEERKGLPVLLRAFEALVEHVPARLTVVGAGEEELARYLPDPETASRIDALGRVPEAELWRSLHAADVLCAPSLAGESFGMILTEAFAAGTPVVASRIAGYSGVVTDGVDGVLVPPADAQALAEELQRLHHEPERRARMGAEARKSAERYAWPRVASEVESVY